MAVVTFIRYADLTEVTLVSDWRLDWCDPEIDEDDEDDEDAYDDKNDES